MYKRIYEPFQSSSPPLAKHIFIDTSKDTGESNIYIDKTVLDSYENINFIKNYLEKRSLIFIRVYLCKKNDSIFNHDGPVGTIYTSKYKSNQIEIESHAMNINPDTQVLKLPLRLGSGIENNRSLKKFKGIQLKIILNYYTGTVANAILHNQTYIWNGNHNVKYMGDTIEPPNSKSCSDLPVSILEPHPLSQSSQNIQQTPQIVPQTPQIVPRVVPQTPQIVSQTPQIVPQTPQIVSQTPQIVSQTPQIVSQTPQIVSQTVSQVVPRVVQQPSQVVVQPSQEVSREYQSIVDELNNQKSILEKEKNDLLVRIDTLTKDLETQKNKLEILKEQKDKIIESKDETIESKNKIIESNNETIKFIESDIYEKRRLLNRERTLNINFAKKIKDMEQTINTKKQDLINQQEKTKVLTNTLSSTQNKLNMSNNEVKNLKEDVNNMNVQIKEFKISKGNIGTINKAVPIGTTEVKITEVGIGKKLCKLKPGTTLLFGEEEVTFKGCKEDGDTYTESNDIIIIISPTTQEHQEGTEVILLENNNNKDYTLFIVVGLLVSLIMLVLIFRK